MPHEINFTPTDEKPIRRDGQPVPPMRIRLPGMFGVPPSLESLKMRNERSQRSGSTLTPLGKR
jgi:hypothetical protein